MTSKQNAQNAIDSPIVLYCDNHVLVVHKPPMLVTQPTQGHKASLEEWAKAWIRKKTNKAGAVFLHAIHRLDREAQGIVLFARTSKALSRLNEAMRQGKIHKTYLAIVEGHFSNAEGVLKHELEHQEHRAKVGKSAKSKEAILKFRVIEKQSHSMMVEVILETGRYHQIRAQFSAIGHPICGDKKYGSRHVYRQPGIALLHKKMTFPHPTLPEEIIVIDEDSHISPN